MRAAARAGGHEVDCRPSRGTRVGSSSMWPSAVAPRNGRPKLAFATMGTWVGDDSLLTARQARDGWNYRRALPASRTSWDAPARCHRRRGRDARNGDTVLATLAARVRDRLPDLPLWPPTRRLARRRPRPLQTPLAGGGRGGAWQAGRCALSRVGRRCAAHPGGGSCAYYTAKHGLWYSRRTSWAAPRDASGAGGGGLRAVGLVDREAEGRTHSMVRGTRSRSASTASRDAQGNGCWRSPPDLVHGHQGASRLAEPALRRLEED